MSQIPLEEEQYADPQEYNVRDILAEYWSKATQEEPAEQPVRQGVSRRSLDALRAEEPEEGVRIYQPRKDRAEAQSRMVSRWDEPLDRAGKPEEPELPEAEETSVPEDGPSVSPLRSARELAMGLLGRFRKDKQPLPSPRQEAGPQDKENLPSFDELLWGRKPKPVRIVEEEEPLPAPEEAPAAPVLPVRAEEPEVEIHIPEEELSGISVNDILSEYWGGLEEDPKPAETQPLPRAVREKARPQSREEAAGGEKAIPSLFRKAADSFMAAGKEGARLFSSRKENREPEERPEPEREPLPAEASVPASPVRAPAAKAPEEPPALRREAVPSSREDVLNMSVDDILSEFWAGYTEAEEPTASPSPQPRSRREASRMREEASPVPPTDAASSAAENEASPRRRRSEGRERRPGRSPREEKHAEGSREAEARSERPFRRQRSEERGRARRESPAKEEASPELTPPPPPVDPGEAAGRLGFLRRQPEKKAGPDPEQRPAPPPRAERDPRRSAGRPRREGAERPRPRETIDEDVDISAMSVDEILAEYNDIFAAIPAAASAIGQERSAEAERTETPLPEAEPENVPRSAAPADAPVAGQGGRVSRMEEEARDFLRQMRSDSFGARREEARPQGGLRGDRSRAGTPGTPAQPAPAPAPQPALQPVSPPEPAEAAMPSVANTGWSESLRRLLDQDPAPPQPAASAEPSRNETAGLNPSRPARSYAIPSDEVDPRFNLSGERKSTMVFGGKELDLSADESYVPPKATGNVGFHWVAGEEELPSRPLEKKKLFQKEKKEAAVVPEEEKEKTEGYDDRSRPEYAPDKDYDEEDAGEDPGAFPSFGQYLSALFSGLSVRLFGARRSRSAPAGTMEIEEEDLGPELSPAAASKYYGSFVTSLRMRVRIALVLLAVLAWITLGLPVSGSLRSVPVAAGLALAIQLTMLLLGLDVVTGALVNLARGRFGADTLAVLTCILTSLDALSVCLGVMGTPHMPLCLISGLSFLGVMLSSLASARGLRKALRVPAIGKRCYGVTAENAVKGGGLTLLKSLRPPKGFVRRTEEAAPDEDVFTRVSPLLAIACVLLALIVALVKRAFPETLYILTVLLCPAVPMMALLCFALPYLFGSLRIFHSGAAIAGWSGVSDIGRSENLIVTDRDLFPEGSVEIDTVRIFAEVKPETVISYAGTMVCASGSDLAPCFSQLMEKNGCPMRRVEGFEYLSGGGMKGVIDGSVILCGGLDLMRLMNVRVPYRLVGKTTVLLAVDGILCGIFNMKYEGQPQVRKALVGLIRSNRHPVFAIRDFLVTPDMLSDCFEVATDGYDFPPYVDRFSISEAQPSADSKLAAVVCREGLGPLVHMADTGRSMYLAVRLNLALTVLAAVLGVIIVFAKLLGAGIVTGGYLLLFLLVWAIPVALISVFLHL